MGPLCGVSPAGMIAHSLTLCIVSDKSIMTVRKYPHTLRPYSPGSWSQGDWRRQTV